MGQTGPMNIWVLLTLAGLLYGYFGLSRCVDCSPSYKQVWFFSYNDSLLPSSYFQKRFCLSSSCIASVSSPAVPEMQHFTLLSVSNSFLKLGLPREQDMASWNQTWPFPLHWTARLFEQWKPDLCVTPKLLLNCAWLFSAWESMISPASEGETNNTASTVLDQLLS